LFNEDKAIVSEIPGTTRDAIEDTISLNGILFRFIDTAGIRKTEDTVENLGIEKTMQKIERAKIVLYMIDANDIKFCNKITKIQKSNKDAKIIIVANKIDNSKRYLDLNNIGCNNFSTIKISAKYKQNISALIKMLIDSAQKFSANENATIITNTRHLELLQKSLDSTLRVEYGLQTGLSSDFIAQDIREILNHIGEITGEYTNDEVLGNIFANFCIGK